MFSFLRKEKPATKEQMKIRAVYHAQQFNIERVSNLLVAAKDAKEFLIAVAQIEDYFPRNHRHVGGEAIINKARALCGRLPF